MGRRSPPLVHRSARVWSTRRGGQGVENGSGAHRDASGSSRYKKIVADESGLDALFVEQFVSAHERAPVSIVLDVDATDDPLHGHQEGRFFHGYYRSYCYLPLYIFCGERLLCARLRPSNIDGAAGEQQLALFADRTSTATMRANQLRLYFSSLAYCALQALRRLGLKGTTLAHAQCDTIRLKLLKLGAQVRVTVRNIWVSFSQSYPYAELFTLIYHRLRAPPGALT